MSPIAKSCDTEPDLTILSPLVLNSIKEIIENWNYIQYDVIVKDLNTGGNNVLGKLFEINIKGATCYESEKEMHIFVKEKIVLKNLKAINIDQLYTNEVLTYKELSKIIMSLQDQADIPQENRFKMVRAYDETSKNAIILEDISHKGFKVYDKAEPVSLKYVQLSVQELAKFHALSMIIENKMPEYFEEKIKKLESSINFNEDWKELMQNICRHIANLCNAENKMKLEKFLPVLLEKLPKYYKDRTNVCTLTHGDYRKNNVMFRSNGDEPVEVIPIDYQFIDYGCPIRDLLLFIFSATDQEFRAKHLNGVKELYFETLSRFLKYFDMDVETVYPREEFEKVYTEWLDFGLMITLFISITLFAPDTGLDLENLSYKQLPFHPDKKFHFILRGLVDDFVKWGYL